MPEFSVQCSGVRFEATGHGLYDEGDTQRRIHWLVWNAVRQVQRQAASESDDFSHVSVAVQIYNYYNNYYIVAL